MKKISLIVSVIAFTILLAAVIIILNFTKGDVKVDILKEKTTVGLLLSREKDDRGWCESHYSALSSLAEELNLEIVCAENVQEESCDEVIRSLINNSGCTILIGALFSEEPYLSQPADEFPDVCFMQVGGNGSAKNLCSFTGRMYQFRYLCGIVAGKQSKTGSIGIVASEPDPDVIREIDAFALGVRRAAPDAVVHVGYSGSRYDDSAAEKAAEKLISDKGIDVIAACVDSVAPLGLAEKRGIWCVGCDLDNSALCPTSYLTGCVWDWRSAYKERILDRLRGKFRGTNEWLGIESGIMELVEPSSVGNALAGYEYELGEARKSFEDHSFDVFYGPVKDNEGNIRVAEGESLSDENIRGKIDWYVEGVEVG